MAEVRVLHKMPVVPPPPKELEITLTMNEAEARLVTALLGKGDVKLTNYFKVDSPYSKLFRALKESVDTQKLYRDGGFIRQWAMEKGWW